MTTRYPAPGAQIEAGNTTLILIDYQPKLMLGCKTIDPKVLAENAIALAEIGAVFGLPIITTGGRPDDPYLPSVIAACGATRQHVERQTIDCFETPEFTTAVAATGRKTLVLAGITTDLCVLMPALSARARGYEVQVVVDASASFSKQAEQVTLMRMQQAGITLTTWITFAAELHRASNWNEGLGPRIIETFRTHHGGMALIGAMSAQG